jgi:hypothetical protein
VRPSASRARKTVGAEQALAAYADSLQEKLDGGRFRVGGLRGEARRQIAAELGALAVANHFLDEPGSQREQRWTDMLASGQQADAHAIAKLEARRGDALSNVSYHTAVSHEARQEIAGRLDTYMVLRHELERRNGSPQQARPSSDCHQQPAAARTAAEHERMAASITEQPPSLHRRAEDVSPW